MKERGTYTLLYPEKHVIINAAARCEGCKQIRTLRDGLCDECSDCCVQIPRGETLCIGCKKETGRTA